MIRRAGYNQMSPPPHPEPHKTVSSLFLLPHSPTRIRSSTQTRLAFTEMHSCIHGIDAESCTIARSMRSQPKPCQAPNPCHAKPCHFPPSSRPPLPPDPQTSISESKIEREREREGERALLIKGIVIITYISEYKDALHAPPAGKRELIIFIIQL